MNQSVSLLVPGGQSAPTPADPKFPTATARSRAAAPFSSVLERAEYRPPERHSEREARSAKPNPTEPTRAKEAGEKNSSPKTERRSRLREKQKQDKPTDDQSLAGACAVNGQPAKPEESTPPTEIVSDLQTEVAPLAATQASSTSTTAGNKTTPTAPLTTEGINAIEAVVPATTQAAAAPAPTPETEPITKNTDDLESLLTPAASTTNTADTISATRATVATKVSAAPPAVVTTAASTLQDAPPISLTIAEVVSSKAKSAATDLPTAIDPNAEVNSAAPASSAREAEVLLALTNETKTVLATAPTPESNQEIISTAAVPEEARQIARAARRFRAETLENADGIGGAKSSETMKTVIKKEELAGVAQQLLPGSAATPVATVTNLPGEARRSLLAVNSGMETLQAASKTSPAPVRADVGNAGESLEVRAASPLPRVSELISREVRMFKRGGDDLVEVVLTPDTKTQISLRLQWREGQVEVQARCDFGDYSSLNTQWAQLQSSLATHGVRLSHLSERTTTGFTEFFNNPNFAQQQNRERQPEAPLSRPESLPAAPAPAAKPGGVTPPRRSNRLFDSWA